MIYLINCRDDFLDNAGDRPSLGTLYLSSYLESRGLETRVFDMNHTSNQSLIHSMIREQPSHIGISMTTPHHSYGSKLARELKSVFPKTKLIAGGPHASTSPNAVENFDYVIIGEGEKTLDNLVRNRLLTKLFTGERIKNLDELPTPDFEKLDLFKYSLKMDGGKALPIITSRGCPYTCIYCTKDVHGKEFRANSAGYVANQINRIINNQGVRNFIFYDDVFTLNKGRIKELNQEFKKNGIEINYRATTRLNCIDETVLNDLKESGCSELCFGIESGNDEILKIIGKQQRVADVFYKVGMIKKTGIKVKAYFMIGLPWETYESAEDTINLMRDLDADEKDVYVLAPYPGTQLWDTPARFGIEIDNDSSFNYLQTKGINIKTAALRKKDIESLWNEAKRYRK